MTGPRGSSSPADRPAGQARGGVERATTARAPSGSMPGVYRGIAVPASERSADKKRPDPRTRRSTPHAHREGNSNPKGDLDARRARRAPTTCVSQVEKSPAAQRGGSVGLLRHRRGLLLVSGREGVHAFTLRTCEVGVATAANQIEGGHASTNWHGWTREPSRIKDGSTPARACDHWNR